MCSLRAALSGGSLSVRACMMLVLLVPVFMSSGRVGAAPDEIWRSATLRLMLSYPQTWKIVPERGAAVLLRSTSGKAEFEIFPLVTSRAGDSLREAADQALVSPKCHTSVKVSSASVGRLGALGTVATGLCIGADLGWRLTITAFHYAGNNLLLRAWLFHADVVGGHDLSAIQASLTKTM
jgi:hypothetical protein